MKFSTKSRYALRLMAELARYAPGTTVSLKEISERQNLSLKYLEQIVKAQGVAALGGKFHGSPLLAVFHSIARYSDFAKDKPLVQTKKVCYHRMEQNLSLRSESMTEKITAADAIRLLDSVKMPLKVALDLVGPA